MDNFQEQMEEIEQLKAEQALHRKQLEENRQRALAKRNQTKHLVTLGKIVDKLLPEDAAYQSEDCKFCSNGTPILKSAVHSF